MNGQSMSGGAVPSCSVWQLTVYQRRVGTVLLGIAIGGWSFSAHGQTQQSVTTRPAIETERWEENWSVLSDPEVPHRPFDALKYLPLPGDPDVYVSLGADLRERVEAFNGSAFGIGQHASNTYLLHRLQVHADLHVNDWEAYIELEDARAPGKISIGPADADRADVEQAFVAKVTQLDEGVLKLRVGRQEFGFDQQRFVSAREGPNVRQAFDAVWGDYETGDWRIISFASHPVQYQDSSAFDDYSGHNLVLDGFRVERRRLGPGNLAVYYLRYENDSARFAGASGRDRRDAFDAHYTGHAGNADFDAEVMGQLGDLNGRPVRAWAFGGQLGYTFANATWAPHPYLQVDTASGNTSSHGSFGTFNPLFPSGYYFPLAGLTSYANLIHVKPTLSLRPTKAVTLQAAVAFQWRQTTNDAIYAIPTQAIPNTAGKGSLWTAAYLQLDASKQINDNVSISAQAVRYQIGQTIRRAGGRDTNYAELQVSVDW